MESFLKKSSLNSLITVFLCCGVGGILANFAVLIGLGHRADLISIGNIMNLVFPKGEEEKVTGRIVLKFYHFVI